MDAASIDSDDDRFSLAFCSVHFLAALQTLFAAYSTGYCQMRQCHFARSRAVCTKDLVEILTSFSKAFDVTL